MKPNYRQTMLACFIGYIVQAIVNNFAPLLFVTFQNTYHLALTQVTALITVNFLMQLLIDVLAVHFVDLIGYRVSALLAHISSAVGLIALPLLPALFHDPFVGILIAVMLYAIGGGLIEVLLSPIMDACPTPNKGAAMSLMHSFYCWGHAGIVLLSTLFFAIWGTAHWQYLSLFWSLIPIGNAILFAVAPIPTPATGASGGLGLRQLFSRRLFWLLLLMMFCAGASDQIVSQWASTFAEQTLGVSKTLGDLIVTMTYALTMGLSRLIYGKYGHRLDLSRFMTGSCLLCILCFFCIALPFPLVNLIGCALCGFSVGIFWPGSFSKASAAMPGGGTAMFALLALSGDLGCSIGPTLAGLVSAACGNDLHIGFFTVILFPLLLLIGVRALDRHPAHPQS